MAQRVCDDVDERLNKLNDADPLWGPLAGCRPAKDRRFSGWRAFLLAAVFGGFFGMSLNLIVALSAGRQVLPCVYAMPLALTSISFVAFRLTLGPAWNRRAYWLARRQDYLANSAERARR